MLYLTGHGGDEFLKFHDQVGVWVVRCDGEVWCECEVW